MDMDPRNISFFAHFLLAVPLFFTGCGPTPQPSPAAAADAFLLTHVRLPPMDGGNLIEDGALLVRDGVIEWVGASGQAPEAEGAAVVDGRGAWVVPGLIDMHVHIQHVHELDLYLLNGVTTVANLSGRPDHLLWRNQIAAGTLRGPTIYTAGPTIDGDPPRNPRFTPAGDAARAEEIVAEQRAAGYDFVKIYDLIDKEAYDGAVQAAELRDMPVVGHIPKSIGLEGILKGHDLIAHAEEFYYTFFNNEDDPDRLESAARLTAGSGTTVCPNTGMIHSIIEQADDIDAVLTRPHLRYLPPASLRDWLPEANRYVGRSADWLARNKRMYPFLLKLTKALHEAGAPLVVGSDAGVAGAAPGFSMHKELAELVKAGLSRREALRAATAVAGDWIGRGLHDPTPPGVLAAGRRADFLLLEANPLENLEALKEIRAVVARGHWMDHKELSATVERRAAEYGRDIEPYNRFKELVKQKDWPKAEALLASNDSEMLDESAVNALGYQYLRRRRDTETAIALFEINTRVFPESWNTWDSLGEAFMEAGNRALAVRHYRRSLELNPGNSNAVAMLKKLESR